MRFKHRETLQCSFCSAIFQKTFQRNFCFRLWCVAGVGFNSNRARRTAAKHQKPKFCQTLTLQSLLFSISLLFSFSDFPCFFLRFSFLFQGFEGFRKERNPCFFGANPCFFQKSKGWRVREQRPFYSPIVPGSQELVLKVPKRCDSSVQGALWKPTASQQNLCDAELLMDRSLQNSEF